MVLIYLFYGIWSRNRCIRGRNRVFGRIVIGNSSDIGRGLFYFNLEIWEIEEYNDGCFLFVGMNLVFGRMGY